MGRYRISKPAQSWRHVLKYLPGKVFFCLDICRLTCNGCRFLVQFCLVHPMYQFTIYVINECVHSISRSCHKPYVFY